MRLTLLRHGQSANNAAWATAAGDLAAYRRVPEPVLTPLGRTQAEAAARWHARLPAAQRPTHVYSSLMARAVLTADPLAEALGLPIQGRLDCFEVGGPYVTGEQAGRSAHPGLTGEELRALTPRLVLPGDTPEGGWWPGPYETPDQTQARARRLVAGLRAVHGRDDHVVVVTHQAFCQPVIAELLGLGRLADGWFHVGNTATCVFDIDGADVECAWLNRRDHLREEDHTG